MIYQHKAHPVQALWRMSHRRHSPCFLGSLDPILLGVGDNLARRNKPITGVTAMGADLSAKRLQILKAAVPSVSRVLHCWSTQDRGHAPFLD